MRIESAELTFLNMPMKQPELWAWGLRNGYTWSEVHTDAESRVSARWWSAWARMPG